MKKKIAFYLFCICAPVAATAQSYVNAGGIRYGAGELGLTFKQLIGGHWTAEGILQQRVSDRTRDFTVAALAEHHNPLISRRFNFFIGGGPQITILGDRSETTRDGLGLAAIAGVEFTLDRLNISWDMKPAVYLAGGRNDFDLQSAFSLRYVFTKREWKMDWSKLKFWDGWFKKK